MNTTLLNTTIRSVLLNCNIKDLDDYTSNKLAVNCIQGGFIALYDKKDVNTEDLDQLKNRYLAWIRSADELKDMHWSMFWNVPRTIKRILLDDPYKDFLCKVLIAEVRTRHDSDLSTWVDSFRTRLELTKYILDPYESNGSCYDLLALTLLKKTLSTLCVQEIADAFHSTQDFKELETLEDEQCLVESLKIMFLEKTSLQNDITLDLFSSMNELKMWLDLKIDFVSELKRKEDEQYKLAISTASDNSDDFFEIAF